ncbi:MAG: hypothetical protein M0030_07695, partial [Actinomycetota bacterium]|nr:hypothetical protein [Actinomycetota bacterium]
MAASAAEFMARIATQASRMVSRTSSVPLVRVRTRRRGRFGRGSVCQPRMLPRRTWSSRARLTAAWS